LRRSSRESDRSCWRASNVRSVFVSWLLTQISIFLLVPYCEPKSVATDLLVTARAIIGGSVRSPARTLTLVRAVSRSRLYLSLLTSVFDIFVSCRTQSLALLTPSHTDTIGVFGNPRSRLSFCGTSVLDWVTCSSSSRLAKRGSECPATFAVFLLDQQLPIKWRFQFLLKRAVASHARATRFPYTICSSRHRLTAFYRTSAARSYLQSCNLGCPAELLSPCILRR
jgi:hypothetical protein